MISKSHPLTKTAQDLRRSLHRLEAFKETFPQAEGMATVDKLIEDIKALRRTIPGEYKDADLER